MTTTNVATEIIKDFNLRFVIDLVNGPEDANEYRCSIYDENGSLLADGWGNSLNSATLQATNEL